MNVQPLVVDPDQAQLALNEYRQHRNTYDARDWEIERIYRAISKGKTVISAFSAIQQAGLGEGERPKLAICRADARWCLLNGKGDHCLMGPSKIQEHRPSQFSDLGAGRLRIEWPHFGYTNGVAELPRIPPQFRPAAGALHNYHILWEADWQDIPRDPYLLRRIAKDAWVVLAAWELTDVEMSVLRAHSNQ